MVKKAKHDGNDGDDEQDITSEYESDFNACIDCGVSLYNSQLCLDCVNTVRIQHFALTPAETVVAAVLQDILNKVETKALTTMDSMTQSRKQLETLQQNALHAKRVQDDARAALRVAKQHDTQARANAFEANLAVAHYKKEWYRGQDDRQSVQPTGNRIAEKNNLSTDM